MTEELTQLLIIEGRPRWEFRYLKNLFESRDVSVKLQYVLLNPDKIGGTEPLPQVAASASRPREETQATLLPQSEMEWMKFDVIILGDISPDALSDADYEALGRFVTDRGGTLVVIAGPDYMPHAFTDTPLADLLPVEVTPNSEPVAAPEESYHIALTPEGQDSVIMRQAVDAAREPAGLGRPAVHLLAPPGAGHQARRHRAGLRRAGRGRRGRRHAPGAADARSTSARTPSSRCSRWRWATC